MIQSKVIQMISLPDGHALFIVGTDNNEIFFRTTRVPEHLQHEPIRREGDVIHTSLYYFPVYYLQKFNEENQS